MRGKMSSFITIRLPRCYTTRETLTLFTKLKSLCSRKLVKSVEDLQKNRDKLMNLARGRDYSALERSIDVQVSRLRRMLEKDPANPRYIQTVWGLGYVFVPDGEMT